MKTHHKNCLGGEARAFISFLWRRLQDLGQSSVLLEVPLECKWVSKRSMKVLEERRAHAEEDSWPVEPRV